MKPYYYVYRYKNHAPIVRHATLKQAQAEAERLAGQHPGIAFEILKVIGIAQAIKPVSTFWIDGVHPDTF